MLLRAFAFFASISFLTLTSVFAQSKAPTAGQPSDIYNSVVRIEAATQVPDYRSPWNSGRFSGGRGTGFLIGKNRFLTNAHVISDARRLLITRRGSSKKHAARVLHVAHDCDLALLELEDFSAFEGLPYLEIGKLPKLESQVRVIGYPVGGDRLSVTRGVVSRIDFRPYSHTLLDSHLVVQIDAAINPGNSGGPVLQDGKVVGVAFQGLRNADNTGYMIPVPVVNRFLKDIQDGQYDQYVDLGLYTFSLFNDTMRKTLGLADDGQGVLVSDITKTGPSDGVIQIGDIVTSLDGNLVNSAGSITLNGETVDMNEIVERKFAGDKITIGIIRDGKPMEKTVTLKPFPPSKLYSIQYGKKPRYIMHGGLVFQPLNRNTYAAHGFKNEDLRYIYTNYVTEAIFEKRQDVVVLSKVLTDTLTSRVGSFSGLILDSVNGTDVKSLSHLNELLAAKNDDNFLVLQFAGVDRPLVLPKDKIAAATSRIAQKYSIPSLSHLGK